MEHGGFGSASWAGSPAGWWPSCCCSCAARACRCDAACGARLRVYAGAVVAGRRGRRARQCRADAERRAHRPHAGEDLHAVGAGDEGRRRPEAAGAPDLLLPQPGSRRPTRQGGARRHGPAQSRCSKCASPTPTRSRRSPRTSACASTTPACWRPPAAAPGPVVDEGEIAIGVQRVLREKVVTVCFLEGHNELPMDNFEYHTHVEGVSNHSHGDARPQCPDAGPRHRTPAPRARGAGLRVRKVVLATQPAVPAECQARSSPIRAPRSCRRKAPASKPTCAGRQPARDVRSRLRARGPPRRARRAARRRPSAGGGGRPAQPLRERQRDGGRHRLRGRARSRATCR